MFIYQSNDLFIFILVYVFIGTLSLGVLARRAFGGNKKEQHEISKSYFPAEMEKMVGVQRVKADQCEFGLTTTSMGTTRPARTPTGFLTNSWCIAEALNKQCDGSHSHFSLMEGRAAKAQEYPPLLCKAICEGLKCQKEHDKNKYSALVSLSDKELEVVILKAGYPSHWVDRQHEDLSNVKMIDDETHLLRIKNGEQWATDDLSGAALELGKVRKARMENMAYFRKMQVYRKVPRSEAKGHNSIRTKWIDINYGDAIQEDYRSRLVALEFNLYSDPRDTVPCWWM